MILINNKKDDSIGSLFSHGRTGTQNIPFLQGKKKKTNYKINYFSSYKDPLVSLFALPLKKPLTRALFIIKTAIDQ